MEAPAHASAWGPVAVNTASFIDYPGLVSTVLFMPGCNLRCPYCQNADIVTYSDRGQSTGLRRHGREEVEAILDGGIGVIDAVVITGGEALSDDNLDCTAELLGMARLRRYRTKVDTNGITAPRIRHRPDLWDRIDLLAMDTKPEADLETLLLSPDMPWESRPRMALELRTTVCRVPGMDTLLETVARLRRMPQANRMARAPWYLQPYRPCEGFGEGIADKTKHTADELHAMARDLGALVRETGETL